MMDGVEIQTLSKHEDERGWLVEILRREHLEPDAAFGQIYVTCALPGQAKGSHYHTRKTEWFCVLRGACALDLLDPKTGRRETLALDEASLRTVKIPPGVAHRFRNTGAEALLLLIYSSEPFHEEAPDAVPVSWEA